MKNPKFFLTTLFAAASALAPVAMTTTTAVVIATMPQEAHAEALDLRIGGGTNTLTESKEYDYIYITNGTLDISGEGTVITTGQFRGTAANGNGATTLNIRSGATLTITGTGDSINSGDAACMLANWPTPGAINVYGTMNLNSGLSSRDGSGTFTVHNGGVVNFVNGLTFASRAADRMNVNLNEGGRMNFGSGGISANGGANITFGAGTIGILGDADVEASWSSSRALTFKGTTIDTTKYIMASDGNSSVVAGGEDANIGGKITFSGAVTSTDVLTKIGLGELGFSGNTLLAGVALEAGTLSLGGSVALSNTIKVSEGATLKIAEGVKISVASNFAVSDATYTDVDGSSDSGNGYVSGLIQVYELAEGAILDGSLETVTYNGKEVSLKDGSFACEVDYSNYYVNIGTVDYTTIIAGERVSELKVVTINAGGVLNLNEDFDFTKTPISLAILGKVNVADGVTLDLGRINAVTDLTHVEGNGTIRLSTQAKVFSVGDGFSGTIEIIGVQSESDPANALDIASLTLGGASKLVIDSLYTWSREGDAVFDLEVEVRGSYVGWDTGAANKNEGLLSNLLRGGDANFTFNKAFTLTDGASYGIEEGTITFAGGLVFGNKSAFTITNGTVYAGDAGMTVSNGATFTITKGSFYVGKTSMTVADGAKVKVSGGTVYAEDAGMKFTGDSAFTISGGTVYVGDAGVTVEDGATLTIENGSDKSSLRGSITIGDKGLVRLTGGDACGYGGVEGECVDKIQIDAGGELRVASSGNQTFSNMELVLAGGKITGEAATNTFRLYNRNNNGNSTIFAKGGTDSDNILTSRIELGFLMRQDDTIVDVEKHGLLVISGAIAADLEKGNGNLVKTGAGTLELTAKNSYEGTTIRDGVLKVSGSGSLGTKGVSGAGILEIASDASLTLNGTIALSQAIVNAGTVDFSSDVVLNLANWESVTGADGAMTFTIVEGGTIGDGWAKIAKDSVKGVVTFSERLGEASVDLTTKGLVKVTTPAKTLTWNGSDNTWNWTDVEWKDALGGAEKFYDGDSVVFDKNATLTVASDGDAGKTGVTVGSLIVNDGVNVSLSGGTVNSTFLTIGAGATLSVAQTVSGGNLSGAGTLDLGSTGGISNTVFTDFWTGTVKLSNRIGVTDFNLNNYGNANSKVELSGLSGWYNGATVTANLILTDTAEGLPAYQVMNGSSNSTRAFSGDISGAGTFDHAWANGNNVTYLFSGDVSEWNGKFIHNASYSKTNSLKFSGDKISVNIHNQAGTLNLSFSETSDAIYSGTITNAGIGVNLTKSGSGVLTISSNDLSLNTVTLSGGILNLSGNGASANGVVFGAGEEATLGGTLFVKGNVTESGAKDGEIFNLNAGSSLVVEGTFGTTSANAGDTSQHTYVLNLGENASLSSKVFAQGNGLTVNLASGASFEADTLLLNCSWQGKDHAFIGKGANSSKVLAEEVLLFSSGTETWGGKTNFVLDSVHLDVGANGISADSNSQMTLKNALLSVADDAIGWSSDVVTRLDGASSVDVDTNKTITLSGAISNGNSAGVLTKLGAGTLVLSGSNSYSGGTNVQAGTLSASSFKALGSGSVTVNSGANLVVSGGGGTLSNIILESGTSFDVSSISGQLSVSDFTVGKDVILSVLGTTASSQLKIDALTGESADLTFNLRVDPAASRVGIVVLTSGAIDATSLDADNLLLNGSVLATNRGADAYFYKNGDVLMLDYTAGSVLDDLVWDASQSGNWAVGGSRLWKSEKSGGMIDFQNGDSVTFATAEAEVVLGGSVTVGGLTVNENASFSSAESQAYGISFTENGVLSVKENVTASFDNSVSLASGQTLVKTGAGTVEVSADAQGLFTGLDIREGKVSMSMASDKELAMSITGEGLFEKTGVGMLTVSGDGFETLSEHVEARVLVSEGAVKIGGKLSDASHTLENSVELGDDGRLVVDASEINGRSGHIVDLNKLSGTGTIEYSARGNTTDGGESSTSFGWIRLSDAFTGTLSVKSGLIDLLTGSDGSACDPSCLGGTSLIDLNGGGLLFRNTTGAVLAQDISVGSNGGVIRLYGNGEATLTGKVSGAENTLAHTDGGTLTFANEVTLGKFRAIRGTSIFLADAEIGKIYFDSYGSHYGDLVIGEAATVNANLVSNSWGVKTLRVDGTLNVKEKLSFTSGTENTVAGSGVINTNEFCIGNAGSYILDGGIRMNIGSGGITETNDWGYSLQIKDAVVGATADWSTGDGIDNAISLTSTENGGAKFDTAGYTITMGVNLSGSGKLTKQGEGTLVLSGANTYSGGTVIGGGTLKIASAGAIGTGAITLAGGTLARTDDVTEAIALTHSLTVAATSSVENMAFSAGSWTFTNDLQEFFTDEGFAAVKLTGTTFSGDKESIVVDVSEIDFYTGADSIVLFDNYEGADTSVFSAENGTISLVNKQVVYTANESIIALLWDPDATSADHKWTGTTFNGQDYSVTSQRRYLFQAKADGTPESVTLQGAADAMSAMFAPYAFERLAFYGDYNFVGERQNDSVSAFLTLMGGDDMISGTILVADDKLVTFENTVGITGLQGTPGNLLKEGRGTLVLAADAEVFELGTIDIQEGTLGLSSVTTGTGAPEFKGTISGAGTLMKDGSGDLVLSVANTHTGGTVVDEGLLRITHRDALGTGLATVNTGAVLELNAHMDGATNARYELAGGTLRATIETGHDKAQIAGGEAISLTADSTVDAQSTFGMISSSYGNNIVDLGGNILTKTGDASFLLCNTTITEGTLKIAGGTIASISLTNPEVSPNATDASAADFIFELGEGKTGGITVGGTTTEFSVKSISTSADNKGTAQISISGEDAKFIVAGTGTDSYTYAGSVSNNGSFIKRGNESLTLSGAVSGSGKLIVEGGTLALFGEGDTSPNFYTGGTEINGGTLKVQATGWSNGVATDSWNRGDIGGHIYQNLLKISNGGVLEVVKAQDAKNEATYGTGGALRGFSVTAGTGTYRYSGEGESLIATASDANTHIGLANGATLVFDVVDEGATLNVSKLIASNADQAEATDALAETDGMLKKIGAGTLVLSGANLYTGGTVLAEGALQASGTALGTSGIAMSAGTELALNGATVSGAISGDGKITTTGETTLSKKNTFAGDYVIDGTLTLKNLATLGASGLNVELNGTLQNKATTTLGAVVTGKGTLSQVENSMNLAGSDFSEFTGDFVLAGGTLSNLTLNSTNGSTNATISGGTAQNWTLDNADAEIQVTATSQVRLSGTITLETGRVVFGNSLDTAYFGGSGAVNLGDDIIFDFEDLDLVQDASDPSIYRASVLVFDTSDINLTGWKDLTWENIQIHGGALDAHYDLEIGDAGNLTIVMEAQTLVWKTDEAIWDLTSTNWKLEEEGVLTDIDIKFADYDTVKFTASDEVTIASGMKLRPTEIVVEGDVDLTLKAAGNAEVIFGETQLESGSSLTLVQDEGKVITFKNTVVGTATETFTLQNAVEVSFSETLDGDSVVSGDLKFVKDGAGTLLADVGQAEFTGSTSIDAGKVVVSATNALGTGTITLNGGALELSAAADTTTTVNNVIAGATATDAPVVISGAGTVELGAENTYSGSTSVSGTAVAKDAAAFGASTVSIEGTVVLNSDKGIFENAFSGAGTLAVASATTATITTSLNDLTGTLEATGGATLIVDTDADSTFSGTLKLSEGDTAGTFEKADATTLTLSGAFESVAGSTLKVAAGTLKVGNNATDQSYAGSLSVSDNVTFEKVGTNVLTLSGALDTSGSASTLKLAEGTLKIGNADTAQSYTGELSLAADTNFEKVGANTLTLAKLTGKGATTVSAGTLELATATDATLESVIDGAGTLKKSGAGALTLAAGTSVAHVDLAAGTLANVELTEDGVSELTVSATGTTLKKATMDAGTLNVAAATQTTLEDEVALSGGTIVLGDITPVEDEATVVGKFKVTGDTTVGADVTFNIDSLTYSTVTNPNTTLEEATVTLNVFDVASGTLIGWDAETLGKGNFTIGESNAALSDRTQLKFEDGNLEISNTIYNLTWEGGDNVWASGNGDAWTHAANPEDTVYMNSDRVTFAADAAVTLGSHVAPTTMTVNAGLDVEIEKSETYKVTGSGSVSLGEDARLVLNSAHDYTGATTLADGATLQLNLAAGDSAQFKSAVLVADGAQGSLMIDTGALSAEAALETVMTGDLSTSGLVLEKLGAGTLSVTDKLSGFTSEGRVEVTAGTLKAYGASALGAASLAVEEGASLNVVADSDAVFGNSLVGQGLFEKSGNAVLTIEQANAFAGDATVSAGTLKLADIDALGDARVDTLFTVAEGATLDIDFGGNFGKTLAGAGTINANSGDILVLGGSGEAFTGTFKVNGGTVRAQTATALGNGTIELADANKKLVFEIIEDESFDGSFVGAGTITVETASLTKTLTWTGDGSSNFSGTVEVKDDSSLAAKNAGMLGNASASTVLGANSELVLGGDVDSTLEAKVSGNGDLVKVGKGTVKLANTANAYSGKTYINEGTLRVDSALALGATSQIQLAEKTVLDIGLQSGENLTFNKDVRGYGDVAISGKGTLNWTQRKLFHGKLGVAGSTLNTTQFFESNSDVVLSENARWNAKQGFSVGANAAITLHAGATPIYTTMATTTVPSGTQLASGGFLASANKEGTVVLSDISVIPGSNGAETLVTFDVNNQSEVKKSRIVLTKDASVSLDNVSIQVLLGDSFVDASNLPEISFINLDGSDARVIGEFTKKTVVFADGTEVEYLYDVRNGNLTLEPVSNKMNLAYAAMVSMPLETFNQDVQSLHRRMDQRRFDTGTNKDQWEFFAQAQSMQVDNGDDRSDSATFDFSTYGSLVGGDVRLGESTVFGLALAYDRGTADIHDNQGEITMDNYRVTAYMGTVIGDSYFAEGGLHYGFASYELDREGEYGVNTGDTNGWSAGAFFTTGGVLPTAVENLFLTPYVGLAYLHTAVEKFDEVGTQSTSVDDMEADSLRARIGVGASYGFSLGEVPSRLGLDLAFSHEFLDDELDADVTAAGMSYTRTLTEKTTSASTVTLGASLDFSLSENTGLYLGYSADLGLNSDIAHRANIGFRFTY